MDYYEETTNRAVQYVTVEEIKRRNIQSLNNLNLDKQEVTGKLNKRLIELSQVVDEYCNTRFVPTSDNFFVDLIEKVRVRRTPLLEVSGLSVKGITLVENEEFFVYRDQNRIEINYEPPPTVFFKKAVHIDYVFGFLEIPQTVRDVIIEILALETVHNSSNGHSTLRSESWDGEYNYQRHSGKDNTLAELRKDILKRLDPFVQPRYVEPRRDGNVRARVL